MFKGTEKLGEITLTIDQNKKNSEFIEFGQIKFNPHKITEAIESHACYVCTIEVDAKGDKDIKVVIPVESENKEIESKLNAESELDFISNLTELQNFYPLFELFETQI